MRSLHRRLVIWLSNINLATLQHPHVHLRYSVVVSTPDSESGNPGSNPGTAILFCCSAILPCRVTDYNTEQFSLSSLRVHDAVFTQFCIAA